MLIALDAGHGGSDPGAVYNGRNEKDDNLRLALAVGDILKNKGVDVVYTRTDDIYETPFKKATDANDAGADYFVSFHRNSSPEPNTYSGVQTLVYNDSGIPGEMARNINAQLEKAGFANLGVPVRKDLIVLKRTKMPAVLVEAGFINTDADNETFDNHFDAIAKGIAQGIEETVGSAQMKKQYGVQIGLYRRYENAQYQLSQLINKGYYAQIRDWNGLYAVVIGREDTLEGAKILEKDLRNQGYCTLIVSL